MSSQECIFCQIANNQLPCFKVWEDEKYLAFLDRFPETEAMTIVIPKEHKPGYFVNVEDSLLADLMSVGKKVAKLIDTKIPNVIRTAALFEGLDIDHIHLKLKPLFKDSFIPNAKLDVTLEDLEKMHKMLAGK